jgi:hypothetical protein
MLQPIASVVILGTVTLAPTVMSRRRAENWVYHTGSLERLAGFWAGVVHGLSAYTLVWKSPGFAMSPPAYRSRGLRGDWENVGRDMSAAMHVFDERP